MDQDEEPVRIPVSDVFDLHAVQPREVGAAVEAYLEEAHRLGAAGDQLVAQRACAGPRRTVDGFQRRRSPRWRA
jgi:hypothetical protein